ncbi:MAG TPA: chromosome segregation protein SMC [Firmicutes bacterium]|nr:chromosome segregation protein SMC [Bacillota bacterium]
MYIKRLEIYGFKSFANKVELELIPGFNAIVGPNGSGKSNILESIRWAMGIDSARLIRGARMEDVIFSGSDGRKGLGLAEVTVILDNSENEMPLGFSEISVTRKLYRSGESEYFINKAPCRLRDIHRLFAGTGLGREGYSVIEQGKIDAILSAKQEDLRAFFEEAIGIAGARARGNEIRRRLDQAKINLLRLNDVIGEIERQLGPLSLKARAAEEFSRCRSQLESLEVSLYSYDLVASLDSMRECLENKASLEDKIRILEGELKSNQERRAALRESIATAISDKDALQAELLEKTSEVERARKDAAWSRERKDSLLQQLEIAIRDRDKAVSRRDSLSQELDQRAARLDAIETQLRILAEEMATLEKEKAEVVRDLEEISSEQEAARADVIEVLASESKLRNDLRASKDLMASQENAIQRLKREYQEQESEMDRLMERLCQLQELLRDGKSELEKSRDQISNLRREEKRKEEERARLVKEQESLLASFARLRSEVDVLQKALESHDGYSSGPRAILALSARGILEGVIGSCGELLKVKEGYEVAIEAALVRAVEDIVVRKAEDAKAAIRHLTQNLAGRATFLPLDLIAPQGLSGEDVRVLRLPGIIGAASSLVECQEAYQSVRDHLLGRVVVARDLDAAVHAAREMHSRLKIVTLDGDIIFPGGAISGGRSKASSGGILSRRRLLETKKAKLDSQLRHVRELEGLNGSLQARLAELRKKIFDEEKKISDSKEKMIRLEAEKSQVEQSISRISKVMVSCQRELEGYAGKSSDHHQQEAMIMNSLKELEEKRRSLEGKLDALASARTSLNERLSDINDRITESKIKRAGLSQEKSGILDTIARVENSIAEVSAAVNQAEKEIHAIHGRITDAERKIAESEELCFDVTGRIEALKARLGNMSESIRLMEDQSKEVEERAGALRLQIRTFQDRAHSVDIEGAKLASDVERLEGYLLEEYGLTREDAIRLAPPYSDRDKAKSEIDELRQRLESIGPVDLPSIDEYKNLRSRHDELSRCRDDLKMAIEGIDSVLEYMSGIMARRFQRAFQLIRREFQSIFLRLFGGGRADLVLQDPDMPLESDISIVSQPPGKRPTSLSLLSGGERALSAIGLAFAAINIRSGPVAILDETDAALDEANLNRFVDFLKDFSTKSQLIVITHRKTTMEAAEAIYGVTMEESGVSKVISLSLGDQATA